MILKKKSVTLAYKCISSQILLYGCAASDTDVDMEFILLLPFSLLQGYYI